MPHDAIEIGSHVIQGEAAHDMVILEKYEAPSTEDGQVAFDPHKDYDLWAARRAMALLKTAYPGHFWAVISDAKQHIMKIGIPILMGVTRWMVINLKQTELTPHAVIAAGGEILERYGLVRGAFQEASFFDARRRYSALVVPSRKVPV